MEAGQPKGGGFAQRVPHALELPGKLGVTTCICLATAFLMGIGQRGLAGSQDKGAVVMTLGKSLPLPEPQFPLLSCLVKFLPGLPGLSTFFGRQLSEEGRSWLLEKFTDDV